MERWPWAHRTSRSAGARSQGAGHGKSLKFLQSLPHLPSPEVMPRAGAQRMELTVTLLRPLALPREDTGGRTPASSPPCAGRCWPCPGRLARARSPLPPGTRESCVLFPWEVTVPQRFPCRKFLPGGAAAPPRAGQRGRGQRCRGDGSHGRARGLGHWAGFSVVPTRQARDSPGEV